ncbi:putative disease resistance protein RGA4 isoform X2 [Carex rostrata]
MAEALALGGASWGMSIAGWVASPIISKLLNQGFSYLEMDVAARIEKLEATILPQFQEVIDAAEKHGCKSNLEKWLRRLKDAMYEAEDALDFYKSRLFQQKNDGTTMKKISNKLSTSLNILSTEEKNLKQCLNKLEKIALEAKDFRDLLERQVKINPKNSIKEPMRTTSIPPLRIFGRDADCDYLLQELLEPVTKPESSQVRSYSVYSIVGVGGAGKTTLAQLFYNHERVTAEFDLRIWLSMTRELDLDHHTRILVEGATQKKCPRLDNFDILQKFLNDSVNSKKILVMMDDVWWDQTMNDHKWEQKWEQFVAPLASVKRGSKILVTSRTENMPCALHPRKIVPLKELEENHFISLFMHHAFGGLEPNSTKSLESLERIGKQIAKKLSRSPLAAKAVGSRLRKNLNEWFWKDTLERDMLTDTMQSLLWSYQNLDAPIQRCFSYCAIFPKGYPFIKRDLILLWVAEGFIHSSTRRMEDVGDDYFQELLSVFFFQKLENEEYDEEYAGEYGMHDLFHDLAERVSGDDCFRIEDGKLREIPLGARHLSIQGESFNEYIKSVEKLKNLRSVIFIDLVRDDVINSFLKKIEKFSKLRVLEFYWCNIKELPNSVGELVLLRYLGLSETQVAELPTSVQKLYNLQTLRLNSKITHLPRGINKLANLRHLECPGFQATSTLPEIGNLTSLQNMDHFRVKNEKGSEISQLKHLNEIRGSLKILDLKNIKNRGGATEAHLKDKKHLQGLSLEWGDDDAMDGNLNAHLEVLEGLEPHSNLKELQIEGYKSPMPPSWMFQQGSHDNLISLKLRKCPSLEVLPPIITLFPCLGKITIEKLPKITKLPLFPLSLKELCIRECCSLVFIYEEELQKGDYEVRLLKAMQDCQFKFILETIPDIKDRARRKLFEECSELRRLMEWESHGKVNDMRVLGMNIERAEITTDGIWEAHLQLIKLRMEYIYSKKEKYPLIVPPGLEKLRISSCYITDEALMHCLAQLTCLKSLHLDHIRTITILPQKEALCQLAVLNELIIESCDFLISLGGLHALVSIKNLSIRDCPCLEISGGGRGTLPFSLEYVGIRDCYSIRHFQVIDLQSLFRATFSNCVQLKSMELRNLSSLKFLHISSCCELETIYSDTPVLERLNVEKCLALQENFSSCNMAWASLKKIEISSFSMLGKLPSRGELVNLKNLIIRGSNEAFFNEDEFGCLTSLQGFSLIDCKVQALPCSIKNLSSLGIISLLDCHESLSLPDMPDALQYLLLVNCPAIASLPVLPKSLVNLYITNCPILSKRCQEPNGEDWPKISHIPVPWRNVE